MGCVFHLASPESTHSKIIFPLVSTLPSPQSLSVKWLYTFIKILLLLFESLHRIPQLLDDSWNSCMWLRLTLCIALWVSTSAIMNVIHHHSITQNTFAALQISWTSSLLLNPWHLLAILLSLEFCVYLFCIGFSYLATRLSASSFFFYYGLIFFLLLNDSLLFGPALFVLLFRLS